MDLQYPIKVILAKLCNDKICFLNGPCPASFLFVFVFSTVNNTYVHYKILTMTGCELRTSGIGNDRSAN